MFRHNGMLFFMTLPHMREGAVPSNWAELVKKSLVLATSEKFEIKAIFNPEGPDDGDGTTVDKKPVAKPANEGEDRIIITPANTTRSAAREGEARRLNWKSRLSQTRELKMARRVSSCRVSKRKHPLCAGTFRTPSVSPRRTFINSTPQICLSEIYWSKLSVLLQETNTKGNGIS